MLKCYWHNWTFSFLHTLDTLYVLILSNWKKDAYCRMFNKRIKGLEKKKKKKESLKQNLVDLPSIYIVEIIN